MNEKVQIAQFLIGEGHPCMIIAEAGVNHNGDLDLAFQLIDSAVDAGADAVKFQSFVTEELIIEEAPKADYQIERTGEFDSQYEMLKKLEFSEDQQIELINYCKAKGILYLCTPYEKKSADMLDAMNISAYKVASTDVTNLPFLSYISQKKRPVILSTGMSTLAEVENAVTTLQEGGLKNKIVLLHCISEYPAPVEEVNLRAIKTLQQAFLCPAGFSDHTPGIGVSPWAVVLGANVIEKHFTLDRNMTGPDHRASLEPGELKLLVKSIRDVESALGDGVKIPMPSELENKSRLQKSIVSTRDIFIGDVIGKDDIACKRPGTGLSPDWFYKILSKKAKVNIPKDTLIRISDIIW